MKEEEVENIVKNALNNYFQEKDVEKKKLEELEKKEKNKVIEAKHIEFHSQSINAWYMSSLEKDKSILTLSVAGIGFMITLLTTKEIDSYLIFTLFCLSILSFLISIIFIIYIFDLNKKYLTNVLHNKDNSCIKLKNKDLVAITSFFCGIIFSIILGITIAVGSINDNKLKNTSSNDINHSTDLKDKSNKTEKEIQNDKWN